MVTVLNSKQMFWFVFNGILAKCCKSQLVCWPLCKKSTNACSILQFTSHLFSVTIRRGGKAQPKVKAEETCLYVRFVIISQTCLKALLTGETHEGYNVKMAGSAFVVWITRVKVLASYSDLLQLQLDQGLLWIWRYQRKESISHTLGFLLKSILIGFCSWWIVFITFLFPFLFQRGLLLQYTRHHILSLIKQSCKL